MLVNEQLLVSAAKPAFSRHTRRQSAVPNATLECNGKALIDLVDGLSSRSIVLVKVCCLHATFEL
jgi:hypothetical protein